MDTVNYSILYPNDQGVQDEIASVIIQSLRVEVLRPQALYYLGLCQDE